MRFFAGIAFFKKFQGILSELTNFIAEITRDMLPGYPGLVHAGKRKPVLPLTGHMLFKH